MQFLAVLFVLLLSGCAELKVSTQKKQVVQDAGTVCILLLEDAKYKSIYRVYVNQKDTNTLLLVNGITEYKIMQGKTNIQVLKERKTASIDLVIKKDKKYTLRVMQNERGDIELLQVPNSCKE